MIDPNRIYTASPDVVRQINRRVVLNLIRTRQPISRADLARLSRMQRSTISLIVEELVEEDWVIEGPLARIPRGRRPTFLRLNENRLILGVDIRPTQTTLALADVNGRFTSQELMATPADPRSAIDSLIGRILRMVELCEGKRIEGIGISLAGRVNASGLLVFAPNLRWKDVDLRTPIAQATGLEVYLENAANACVLAAAFFDRAHGPRGSAIACANSPEAHGPRGAAIACANSPEAPAPRSAAVTPASPLETGGPGPAPVFDSVGACRNLVVLTVSEGIGAGILINGQLARGLSGMAGEFGHLQIDPFGPPCRCGSRGCWEIFGSNRAALRYYMESSAEPVGVTFDDLLRLADQGDDRAVKALDRMAHSLGHGMRLIVAGLAPERIIVIGELTRAWPRFGPIIEAEVRAQTLPGGLAPELIPAHEDGLARLRGTVALVLQKHFGAALESGGQVP